MFDYNSYALDRHQAEEDRATEEQEAAAAQGITVSDLRDQLEDARYDRYCDAREDG